MIVWPEQGAGPSAIGEKAFRLNRMRLAGLPVPDSFSIPFEGTASFSMAELERAVLRLDSRSVAVRSSAVDEDAPRASSAGIYATRLGVAGIDQVARAVREVLESANRPAPVAYRAALRLSGLPRMAVLVQVMLEAEAAGILFTRNPMGGDHIVVEGSWGLGETVVSGEVTPDRWLLNDRGTAADAVIADKDVCSVTGPNGTMRVSTACSIRRQPCLSQTRLAELAALSRQAVQLFGAAQNIEWALASDRLWLLQSRPLTG